jgi:hypothetical protein
MPLDEKDKYEVKDMIRAEMDVFHRREVFPVLARVEEKTDKNGEALQELLWRTDERKKAQDEAKRDNENLRQSQIDAELAKTGKQNWILGLLALVVAILTLIVGYAAYRVAVDPHSPVIGHDPSIGLTP